VQNDKGRVAAAPFVLVMVVYAVSAVAASAPFKPPSEPDFESAT
jgi:hypothetical protein